jgi:hypothetical protein
MPVSHHDGGDSTVYSYSRTEILKGLTFEGWLIQSRGDDRTLVEDGIIGVDKSGSLRRNVVHLASVHDTSFHSVLLKSLAELHQASREGYNAMTKVYKEMSSIANISRMITEKELRGVSNAQ